MKFWCPIEIRSIVLRNIAVILLVAVGVTVSAASDSPIAATPIADSPTADAALASELMNADRASSAFTQSVIDANGRLLEQSFGKFSLARPKLRWEVYAPFPQILIIADEELKIYDPDLEQLTVKSFSGKWADVPLAIFTSEHAALGDYFNVSWASEAQDQFVLKPKSNNTLFRRITIGIANSVLSVIEIVDHTDQITRIEFQDYQANQVIESTLFELQLPPDTEIVRG